MSRLERGMTIIEMSVTLALMIGLAGIIAFSFGGYREWKLGKEASSALQGVYVAQKALLADQPTLELAQVQENDLIPYLPGGDDSIPQVESLDGSMMSIDFSVMPPVVSGNYDPSPATDDGVWDIGRH